MTNIMLIILGFHLQWQLGLFLLGLGVYDYFRRVKAVMEIQYYLQQVEQKQKEVK